MPDLSFIHAAPFYELTALVNDLPLQEVTPQHDMGVTHENQRLALIDR